MERKWTFGPGEKLSSNGREEMSGAIDVLNKACEEVGVCPSSPGIKHAAELWKEGSKKRIRVGCFEDGMLSSCVVELGENGKTKAELCCYTAEKGGNELYFAWLAHLTSPEVGYKQRSIEVE